MMALSLAQQEQISMFITMTRTDTDTAISFLNQASWNMETAIDRYYTFDGDVTEFISFQNATNSSIVTQRINKTMTIEVKVREVIVMNHIIIIIDMY